MNHPNRSWIERLATRLRLIPELDNVPESTPREVPGDLDQYPPPEQWNDWVETDASAWPEVRERHFQIVPTTCFNCESACGLLGYVDRETGEVQRFEGNPWHPGSRGRNCAKGPATINQIQDVDRILYPLKRNGPRGSGMWQRVTWQQVLDDLGQRIGTAIREGRNNEVVYHVGRPGHEGYMDRVLNAWGVDGHNSHTNVCSAAARLGYSLWHGYDRPSPDHANARFVLLVSAHLESGHYFNPHAQRIIEARLRGARMAVLDTRLSNTASVADYWFPTQPGSEAALLLTFCRELLRTGAYDRTFLETWTNWRTYLKERHPDRPLAFDSFIEALIDDYAEFTPEFAARECGVDTQMIHDVVRDIAAAGNRLATHTWRGPTAGHLGGWCVARCLHFLNVITGSVGTPGGTSPNGWNKFKPTFFDHPPAHKFWNELHFPIEYPLAHYEMSFLLPHFLKEGRGVIDTYFTRVFNPVWSYPDGFSWIEVLSNENLIRCHVAMTPTWNETAYYADYVLPMGHSSERHDLNSYETHSGTWIAFRQPILREVARRNGQSPEFTWQVNPGEVWEEDEFWIELSWSIDREGDLGIRKHFLSPYRDGQKITIDEYYQFIFERVPGLPEHASKHGLSPLEYMRKFGAFDVEPQTYLRHLDPVDESELEGAQIDHETGTVQRDGRVIGVLQDGQPRVGFPTPSRRQEIFSPTMVDWKWPEYAAPSYIKSHVHPDNIDRSKNEFVLLPTFRLPVLIHSRSGNAKWLAEIANRNPVWIHTNDAAQLELKTGDLIKVATEIGHFVDRVWVTEAIRPGVVACSHHLGRWRRAQDPVSNRWAVNLVGLQHENGVWRMSQLDGTLASREADEDPDFQRIFWPDGGVPQNLIHVVQPDPISGMHCWHQKVTLSRPTESDRAGDVVVDTNKSIEVYRRWLAMTRPGPGPGNLRRPLWMKRPLRPVDAAYQYESK